MSGRPGEVRHGRAETEARISASHSPPPLSALWTRGGRCARFTFGPGDPPYLRGAGYRPHRLICPGLYRLPGGAGPPQSRRHQPSSSVSASSFSSSAYPARAPACSRANWATTGFHSAGGLRAFLPSIRARVIVWVSLPNASAIRPSVIAGAEVRTSVAVLKSTADPWYAVWYLLTACRCGI